MRSLSNVCNVAGFDVTIFEDFADETYDLLKKLPEALNVGNAEDVLHETFSEDTIQNYIITHLRVCDRSLWCIRSTLTSTDPHGCVDEDPSKRLRSMAHYSDC